jgi:hypothetical protein
MKQHSIFAGMLVAFLCVAGSAHAQWVWKDELGHTVISDQPPPATVPASRIVKQPRGESLSAPSAPVAGTDGDAPNAPGAPKNDAAKPKSLADQEKDYEKRQKAAADAQKKTDEAAAQQQQKQAACTEARHGLAALQSGQRVVQYDDKGDRSFMDDAQRQAELARTQGVVDKVCN